MATAPSLFGATPESIQQARDDALNKEANAYAQLDPFQRASAGLYRGGSQLGGAIGRMLGGQDPAMLQMQNRQELIKGVNPNDLASIAAGIQKAMAANDYPAAQELAANYKVLEESQSKTGLEKQQMRTSASTEAKNTADVTSNAQGQQDRVSTLTNAGVPSSQAAGIASNPAAFAQVLKDKNVATTVDYAAAAGRLGFPVNPTMGGYSQEQMRAMTDYINQTKLTQATAARATSTVNLPPQEKKEQSDRGALLVSQYKDVSSQAGVAAKSLPSLESQLMIMDKADFSTGFGTSTVAAGARILGALGVADAEKFATNAQSFTGMAAQAVLTRQLEQKGPQTEADAARITQTGAQLGNTKEANRFLVDVAKSQFKRDLKQRSFYDKWFKENKTYDGAEDAWFTTAAGGTSLFASEDLKKYATSASAASQIPSQSAVAPPARQVPQAAQAPQYATNPSTGQRIMSMDGGSTWQPRR
jgi:hypothetical protein